MLRIALCIAILCLASACDTTERDRLRAENRASGVGVNGERFRADVSGDVTTEITPGFAQYYFAQDLGAFQLLLYDGDSMYRVVFLLPATIGEGVYSITPLIQQERTIAEPKAMLAGPRDLANFSMGASGQLTITHISPSAIAGLFSFSVRNFDAQEVLVVGDFADVPRTD